MLVNEPALDKLQALRDRLGKPLIVRSAYRSPEHNRAVGGAKRSKYMEGTAFDIAMSNHDPEAFEAAAREAKFLGFGFYPRSGFMHADLSPARQWGERFPPRAVPFAAETSPVRETLAQSRTMKGGGAAGVATLGAAGVEVTQEVLAEIQTSILPLVPYLGMLRWVFIAVVLGGIAVPPRRLEAGAAVISGDAVAERGARQCRSGLVAALAALAILLFLLDLRRSGERAGRLAERLQAMEKTHDAQRRMLEAAARRPRSRDDLAERMRGGRF